MESGSDVMNAAIGIDGGGTKTAFVIGNEKEIFYQIEKSGCSYLEIGKEAVVDLIVSGVKELLKRCPDTVCDGCCIGLPCYGENRQMDEWFKKTLCKALSPIKVQLVNDAVVGWAGSLEKRASKCDSFFYAGGDLRSAELSAGRYFGILPRKERRINRKTAG